MARCAVAHLLFVDLCKESNIPVVLVHPLILIITVMQRIRSKVHDIEAFLSMESAGVDRRLFTTPSL